MTTTIPVLQSLQLPPEINLEADTFNKAYTGPLTTIKAMAAEAEEAGYTTKIDVWIRLDTDYLAGLKLQCPLTFLDQDTIAELITYFQKRLATLQGEFRPPEDTDPKYLKSYLQKLDHFQKVIARLLQRLQNS